jgi:hypothetical protein
VTWWDGLWASLGDPEWVAGLLSTFVGATLAFLGAWLLVRLQLGNDRRIAQEQLEAMTSERASERRAQAATALGRAIVTAADAYQHLNTDDLLGLLRAGGEAPGARIIYDAEMDARLLLDLDETTLDLWRALIHTWRICVYYSRKKAPSRGGEEALANSADTLLTPVSGVMAKFGVAMLRWDGRGPIPGSEVLDGWAPVPVADRPRYSEWSTAQAQLFEETRVRLEAKYEERLRARTSGKK